jgi:hypothetical protein
MFLDEISIQTSILIYAGLGFVFFLGFGYYFYRNPIQKSGSVRWSIFLGCIRGLILTSLLIAILPFKVFESSNFKDPAEFIFVVDFPELMSTDFDETFKKVDSILKIKYPDLIWIDFNGRAVFDFKKSGSVSHSLKRLNQSLRKFNTNHANKEVFILTDGNLTDLNIEFTSKIHLISQGKILNKEQIEFSTTHLPIVSVPGEEVHLPIEVWLKNFKQNKDVTINVFLDGSFWKKEKISFDNDHTYLMTDVELKSDQLGKHQIKVTLGRNLSTIITWNVLKEKAIVYGYTDALDPDVGVLNRVAKNKFIQLIWSYDVNAKIPDKADKFIFLRTLPKDIYKSKVINSPALFLHTSKEKTALYWNSNHHVKMDGESLWDLQMKEFQTNGTYAHSDSTMGVLFDNLFLNNKLDSLHNESALVNDLLIQDATHNSLGRNDPKLNFLANKNYIDLLEINDLASVDFNKKDQISNSQKESVYVWQNIYFKLWLLFIILTEWLIRKFRELR